MKILLSLFLLTTAINISTAQSKVSSAFAYSASRQAIPKVPITENGKNIAVANGSEKATVTIQNGNYQFTFSSVNYKNQTINADVRKDTLTDVLMYPEQKNPGDAVIVSTTRNNRPIENAPIKTEVSGKEEMNEESAIKPASIASIPGDVSDRRAHHQSFCQIQFINQ